MRKLLLLLPLALIVGRRDSRPPLNGRVEADFMALATQEHRGLDQPGHGTRRDPCVTRLFE